MTLRLATQLPGENPGGRVLKRPYQPLPASESMFGVLATSSGVFPPSSAMSLSAIPSPIRIIYFIGSTLSVFFRLFKKLHRQGVEERGTRRTLFVRRSYEHCSQRRRWTF